MPVGETSRYRLRSSFSLAFSDTETLSLLKLSIAAFTYTVAEMPALSEAESS